MTVGGGGGIPPGPGPTMTNGTVIQLRRSVTRDVPPDGTVLYEGEIAINTNNRKLYTRIIDGVDVVEGIPFGVLEANLFDWTHDEELVPQTIVLDSIDILLHNSAKYYIEIQSSGANPTAYYQAIEVIVIHNGIDASFTRYGLINTNGEIATIDVDIVDGFLRLKIISNGLDGNQAYRAKFVRIMHQI